MTNSATPSVVKCPNCQCEVPWLPEQIFRPFCSERCKLIDLGEWVMEERRIAGEPVVDIEENNDISWQ